MKKILIIALALMLTHCSDSSEEVLTYNGFRFNDTNHKVNDFKIFYKKNAPFELIRQDSIKWQQYISQNGIYQSRASKYTLAYSFIDMKNHYNGISFWGHNSNILTHEKIFYINNKPFKVYRFLENINNSNLKISSYFTSSYGFILFNLMEDDIITYELDSKDINYRKLINDIKSDSSIYPESALKKIKMDSKDFLP